MALLTIVQARTGSTRLPGKTLLRMGGATILGHVIARLRMSTEDLGQIVVATSVRGGDNAIQDECSRLEVECFRGPEHDVLRRFHNCASKYAATQILRVTADCPLLDPLLVDQLVRHQHPDVTRIAGAPKGVGEEELITAIALARMHEQAIDPYDREHVSTLADRDPAFHINYLHASDTLFDHRNLRLTLDTPEDWNHLKELWEASGRTLFAMSSDEMLGLIDSEPLLELRQ